MTLFSELTAHNRVPQNCLHNMGSQTMLQALLHLSCTSHGVEISTCLQKTEVVNMLKEHLGSDYEVYEVHEDEDVLALFIIWQNMTGWDLDW